MEKLTDDQKLELKELFQEKQEMDNKEADLIKLKQRWNERLHEITGLKGQVDLNTLMLLVLE